MGATVKNYLKYGGLAAALAIGGEQAADKAYESPSEKEMKYVTAQAVASDPVKLREIQGEEIAERAVGQEIKSMRTETAQHFKGASKGQFNAHIYAGKKFFHDPDGDSLMAVDLTVHDVQMPENIVVETIKNLLGISEKQARINGDAVTLSHDRYVKAGPYAATWKTERPDNYTIHSMDGQAHVGYELLNKLDGVTVETIPITNGMKQTYVIEERGGYVLKWKVNSTSPLICTGGGVVVSGQFTITAPIAWDVDSTAVPVLVSVLGDILTYELKAEDGVKWPVTVDPTTTAFNDTDSMTGHLISDWNGNAWEYDRNHATACRTEPTAFTVGMYPSNGASIYRSLLRFDTSSIGSGSTVTSSYLKVQLSYDQSTADFFIQGIAPHDSLAVEYFNTAMFSRFKGWAASGAYSVTTWTDSIGTSGKAVNDSLTFTLNAAGIAGINKSGTTQLYLLSLEDVADSEPVSNEVVYFNDDNLYLSVTYSPPITAPTVTTQAASSVEATTATGNGNITAINNENATIRGIQWDVHTHSGGAYANDVHDHGDYGTGAFTTALTSLPTGTTIYARAYATNSAGTGYGDEVTFLTKPAAATVTTQAASSVETTTATGNGNITATGGENATIRGIQWDVHTHSGGAYANDVHDHGDYGTGAFTTALTSLPTGTTIYARAYATNSAGTGYGDEVTFLTKPAAATGLAATENSASEVTISWTKSTGATQYHVFRDATDLGAAGDVDHIHDTGAAAPVITPGAATATDGTWQTNVILSVNESVANGTTHTYKVVASNTTGNAADSNTDTGYRLASAPTYQWQRSAGDSDASYSNITDGLGGTTDPYLDTFAPSTGAGRWYKCVISATGSTPATSTSDRGYRLAAPTVTTQAASSVATTTATGNGNITATGGENATIRGIQWDVHTHSGGAYANDVHDHGDYGTGAFTTALTSLPTGTTIYARAYATNSAGTGYGDEVTFLTKPAAATGLAATENSASEVTISWTKSTGATQYHVFRDATDLGAAGDVDHIHDTGAAAPLITAGASIASDGASTAQVNLSLSGTSVANGTSYTYKVVASNTTGNAADSNTDTGYRSATALTYQWNRSAGDSDASYSTIGGATASTYADTGAPSTGAGRWYKCVISATGSTPATSTSDRGYRLAAPSNFANTGATTTTLSFSWTDNSSEELGFKIKNAGGDTATVGTYAAGATTGTVSGLGVNTRHGLRVVMFNADGYSTPSDSVLKFTLANSPVTWAFTQYSLDGTKINISFGTNSNPSGTQYAIRDSTRQKWVDSAGRADSTWRVWLTATQWTTLAQMIGCAPNNWERIGVVARNGDGVETSYIWSVVPTVASLGISGTQTATNDAYVTSTTAVYATARNADPYAAVATDSVAWVGQGTGNYSVFRYFSSYVLSPTLNMATALACSQYVWLNSKDVPGGDFELDVVLSNQKGAPATSWAKNFYGWAASGAYSVPANLVFGYKNTADMTAPGWVSMPFTGAWADSLAAAIARSDSFRLAFLSNKDMASTQPSANEAISIRPSPAAAPHRPYLSLNYTLKKPTGFTVTSVSATSLKAKWNEVITGETGYRIRDAITGAYIDSSGANVDSVIVTGLSPNSLYSWIVQVKGGTADGSISAADSSYTQANTPTAPTLTFLSGGLLKFIVNVNGNPSYTEFAVQDSLSGKYVFSIAGPDSFGTAANWKTFLQWGGAAGDTVSVGIGKKYNLRVKARSGQ